MWPLSQRADEKAALPSRLDSLEGKVVAELWNWLYKGDEAYPVIREELRKCHPGITFVSFEEFGNIFGANERAVIDQLPGL